MVMTYSSKVLRRLAACVLAAVTITACSRDGREMKPPTADQTQTVAAETTAAPEAGPTFGIVAPWADGAQADPTYTCLGNGVSPELTFVGVASDIITLAVTIVEESTGAVQWAMANIDVANPVVPLGTPVPGAIQAVNANGTVGYFAPCPPAGTTGTYRLTGYAVPQQIELPDGVDSATLIQALEAAALDVTSGTFVVVSP